MSSHGKYLHLCAYLSNAELQSRRKAGHVVRETDHLKFCHCFVEETLYSVSNRPVMFQCICILCLSYLASYLDLNYHLNLAGVTLLCFFLCSSLCKKIFLGQN